MFMEKNKNKAWLVFWVVYAVSVVIPMCQFKVPPVMGSIIDELGLTPSTAGLTMSVFAITGIVLAFPAVTILRKIGPKMSGVIALVLCVIGSVFWRP